MLSTINRKRHLGQECLTMADKDFKTPSRTSPKNDKRGCLCPDNKYSRKCCDGSLQAQGIGTIYKKA